MKNRTKAKETTKTIRKVKKKNKKVYKLNNIVITIIILINELSSVLDTPEERELVNQSNAY